MSAHLSAVDWHTGTEPITGHIHDYSDPALDNGGYVQLAGLALHVRTRAQADALAELFRALGARIRAREPKGTIRFEVGDPHPDDVADLMGALREMAGRNGEVIATGGPVAPLTLGSLVRLRDGRGHVGTVVDLGATPGTYVVDWEHTDGKRGVYGASDLVVEMLHAAEV